MIRSLAAPSVFLTMLAAAYADGDLLSYWNFNNTTKNSETSLGTFNNEPAMFGEAFDPQTKRISGNTNFNTVFHGDNVYLDLSELSGGDAEETKRTWGAFVDSKANKLKQDDTQGGSLLFSAPNNGAHITFVLSTEGYKNLAISYAHRANDAAVIQWSYSLDGKTFTQFKEVDRATAFSKEILNLSGEGGLGLSQLDNQKTIYLRATLVYPAAPAGSLAFDNFQLTGSQ